MDIQANAGKVLTGRAAVKYYKNAKKVVFLFPWMAKNSISEEVAFDLVPLV